MGWVYRRVDIKLNNSDVSLLEQQEIHIELSGETYYLGILSNYKPQWYCKQVNDESCIPSSFSEYDSDTKDNDGDGETDESGVAAGEYGEPQEGSGHVGWFFDLPYKFAPDGLD